jgi:hypothetical protein
MLDKVFNKLGYIFSLSLYLPNIVSKMKNLLLVVLVFAVVMLPAILLGQPSSGTSAPGCFPPPCIPIDGGASLLILAGLAIGGKKAYDISRRKEN